MKVLVIEDTPEVVEAIGICFTIRWPDATVISSQYGGQAPQLVESMAPDIMILDLGLPDMDGIEVLREIRAFSDVPVIIVTANAQEAVVAASLELGADDYIVKPFPHLELMARAKAVLRRAHMPTLWGDEGVVKGRGMSIDLQGRRLLIDGREVPLTPTEWRLLSCLVRNERRVVSHDILAQEVWGTDFLNDAAIKMCVRRLRLKLSRHYQVGSVLRTHRGLGYSFARPG